MLKYDMTIMIKLLGCIHEPYTFFFVSIEVQVFNECCNDLYIDNYISTRDQIYEKIFHKELTIKHAFLMYGI